MNLHNFSDDELREELAGREKAKNKLPERGSRTDTEVVELIYKTVKSCVDKAIKENYWDEDNNQYIFEAVMMAFYGDDYFHFHNQRFP